MSLGSNRAARSTLSRRLPAREPLKIRARLTQAVRRFFLEREYLEVETPCLIPAPAPELHIDALPVGSSYLQTSPELCMKRLLAAGHPRLFQICKCFRGGERGRLHLPEFTVLEWYRAGIDYRELMMECEALLQWVSRRLGNGVILSYQGSNIDLSSPWTRMTVQEAFAQYTDTTPQAALESGSFDLLMADRIEPHLGTTAATFLCDYPASLAPLAKSKAEDPSVAERFEIYVAGVELANGFSELNDPAEQRVRFLREREQRARAGKPVYPMPERFLSDLERMPDAAGIALGLDRLAMLFLDTETIDDAVAFAPHAL